MTPEEQLAYERAMAEILAVRNPPKPLWRELLLSSIAGALITAIGGTIGGGLVVTYYQAKARQHEQELADAKLRAEARRQIVDTALTTLDAGKNAERSLYLTTRRDYQIASVATEAKPELLRQVAQMVQTHNDFTATWQTRKRKIAADLSDVFPDRGDIIKAWNEAAAALDALIDAAEKERAEYDALPASTADRKLPPSLGRDVAAKAEAFAETASQASHKVTQQKKK